MVAMAELKRIKIDAVEEVHQIRERLANYSSERIQELAMKAQKEIEKSKKCSQ